MYTLKKCIKIEVVCLLSVFLVFIRQITAAAIVGHVLLFTRLR